MPGQREFLHAEFGRFRQRFDGFHHNGQVTAEPEVENAGYAVDLAVVDIVKAVFGASPGKDDGVVGNAADQVGIGAAVGFIAVTAAHHIDMVQIAFGQGRGELVADGADGFPPETGGDGSSAVDAGKSDLFRGAALFNGGDNGGGEILFQMGYAADTGVAGGKNAVGIGGQGQIHTARGENDGGGNMVEFLLLVLPARAVMPFELGIFTEFGIGVGREHLSVGIDIHTGVFGLLQDLGEDLKMMAADDDKGAGVDDPGHAHRRGTAVSVEPRFVGLLHGAEADAAHFFQQGVVIFFKMVGSQSDKGFVEKTGGFLVFTAQRPAFVGVESNAADAEKEQRL